jgi:hypothetical protein
MPALIKELQARIFYTDCRNVSDLADLLIPAGDCQIKSA